MKELLDTLETSSIEFSQTKLLLTPSKISLISYWPLNYQHTPKNSTKITK